MSHLLVILGEMGIDEEIAKLAAKQHGLFTRRQAMDAGASSSLVDRRLKSGRWVVAQPGVYGMPGAPMTWERRTMAACLAAGPDAVVSHRSAAVLHGFTRFRPGPPELTVPLDGRRADRRLHRATDLSMGECTRVRGIPVTTVMRTLLDLAWPLRYGGFGQVLDDLVVARRFSLDDVITAAGAYARRGKPGSTCLREVLCVRGPGYVPPESVLERKLLAALTGLPAPLRQQRLGGSRVDFCWPAQRLVVEADGRRWHTREADFVRDRSRDAEAAALGFRTVRVTWDDLLTRPDWVRDTVRAALFSGSSPPESGGELPEFGVSAGVRGGAATLQGACS